MILPKPKYEEKPLMRLNKLSPQNEELALKYLSKKRGKFVKMIPRNLGEITSNIIPSSKTDKSKYLKQLKDKWPEIVGEKIAKLCFPEAIKGKNLILRTIGAATPLLQMRANEILGLSSLASGVNLSKLSFVQTKLEIRKDKKNNLKPLDAEQSQAIEEKLAKIENKRLKNAIRMLNIYIQNMP